MFSKNKENFIKVNNRARRAQKKCTLLVNLNFNLKRPEERNYSKRMQHQ